MSWQEFKSDLLAQNLKGKWPLPSAVTVFPVTFISAIACIVVGYVIQGANHDVRQVEIPYDSSLCDKDNQCQMRFTLNKSWKGSKIVSYYRIKNFPLNHRQLVQSHCMQQLMGEPNWRQACTSWFEFANVSYVYYEDYKEWDGGNSRFRVPMGTRANIMFNDTFKLYWLGSSTLRPEQMQIPWTSAGILTRIEKLHYVKYDKDRYSQLFNNTVAPRFWRRNISDLPDGLQNVDFVVWMRPESRSSSFKKIYRYIDFEHKRMALDERFRTGLPPGNYRIEFENNWAAHSPLIQKSFILFKPSWYGNEDKFLHLVCFTVGIVYLLLGAFMLFVHKRRGKSLEEMAKLDGEEEEARKTTVE